MYVCIMMERMIGGWVKRLTFKGHAKGNHSKRHNRHEDNKKYSNFSSFLYKKAENESVPLSKTTVTDIGFDSIKY